MIPQPIFSAYGFDTSALIQSFGSGHIHKTFKVHAAGKNFILQRINHFVFKRPELITRNIRTASDYLLTHHPDYTFLKILKTSDGKDTAIDSENYQWRLFPFIENTSTINEIQSLHEAFEAARGFARLTRNLSGCDPALFAPTIDRFHDLRWRYQQFETALQNASTERLHDAHSMIESSKHFSFLVDQYEKLIASGSLRIRITHNDTKINNILFDSITFQAACVIDLDTLMPGYFIYDLGDMVRTFVSPASEGEKDYSKVIFRKAIYDALVEGYLSEMDGELSAEEKKAIPFAGLMMTYIIALRFLTDFLNGDVYFSTLYEGENLIRARNQFRLLQLILENVS